MTIAESELRSLVLKRLAELGFTFDSSGSLSFPDTSKLALRNIHAPAKRIELHENQAWLDAKLEKYEGFFANGTEVKPSQISPTLVQVTNRWHCELYRIARLSWSLPYSKGFGRRLRYLIIDSSNDKLIGLLGLQSPPLSFPARDRQFTYPEGKKTEIVNQTMDIQTLGAVPPYARLLGAKLIAYAAVANEVREDYASKYTGKKTEMEGRVLPPNLVALTTTSAYGRSSIYNRLRYRGKEIAQSLGYTDGYGTFHLMDLYPYFREFLEAQGISTRGGFGTGPRRKWQTMVLALERIGLQGELLRHGVQREAFLFPLAENLRAYIAQEAEKPVYREMPFMHLAEYWKQRWLLPRSERVDGWHNWQRERFLSSLKREAEKK